MVEIEAIAKWKQAYTFISNWMPFMPLYNVLAGVVGSAWYARVKGRAPTNGQHGWVGFG